MSLMIDNQQTDIIDFHVHTFPDGIAEKALSKLALISGLTPSTNGTISNTLTLMNSCGVDLSVLLNIATSPTQQSTINSSACKTNSNYSNRFISFGSVHFQADDAIDELERIKSLGIKGVKLHPDYQGFMIDDEQLFPIYEKCEELGLILVFHSGWDCYSPDVIHALPKASRNVVRRFKKLNIVLAHFGGLKLWDDVGQYLCGENVYLDTSMCYTYMNEIYGENQSKILMKKLIESHYEDKILFGSDCPWENPKQSIEFICSLNITNSVKIKIFNENAKKLLGLI